jgi:transcriptional regulator with XRE-family HTH domain
MNKPIAWNIRYLRVRLGLSQVQLATDSDVDTSYISRLERGLENPTIRTLDRIAKALGVATVELLAKPHGKKPKPLPRGRKPK